MPAAFERSLKVMITFSGRPIGPGHPCLVIAELGTSHQGDLARARALIDAAVAAGAECVKFQLVHAEEILHPRSGFVPLPTGSVALYDTFRALEQGLDFYAALKEHTEAAGALFLCSPFGLRSARELRQLGCGALKIASPELNHFPLLRGGFRLRRAVVPLQRRLAARRHRARPCGHGHGRASCCFTASPPTPRRKRSTTSRSSRACAACSACRSGLSDHSLDPVLVPALAVLHGACCVEKHFTLSRAGGGLDDPIALEPAGFRRMVEAIRRAESEAPAEALTRLRAGLRRGAGCCRDRIRREGAGPLGAGELRAHQPLDPRGPRDPAGARSSAMRTSPCCAPRRCCGRASAPSSCPRHRDSGKDGTSPTAKESSGRTCCRDVSPARRGDPALAGLAPIGNIG